MRLSNDGPPVTVASNQLMYAPKQTNGTVNVVEGNHTGGGNIVSATNPYGTTTIDGPKDYSLAAGSSAKGAGGQSSGLH